MNKILILLELKKKKSIQLQIITPIPQPRQTHHTKNYNHHKKISDIQLLQETVEQIEPILIPTIQHTLQTKLQQQYNLSRFLTSISGAIHLLKYVCFYNASIYRKKPLDIIIPKILKCKFIKIVTQIFQCLIFQIHQKNAVCQVQKQNKKFCKQQFQQRNVLPKNFKIAMQLYKPGKVITEKTTFKTYTVNKKSKITIKDQNNNSQI
eukprot:TRINITY_DN2962_c1_g1_i3.p2 TRINITY_DN2962_c1_g1~~TRINITY_DN2962_c1_g1_i3.p2  ORF type:complete len:207 (+),score=-7.02 TRINITY_DN2962_c1_g1_i3:309-929(+)